MGLFVTDALEAPLPQRAFRHRTGGGNTPARHRNAHGTPPVRAPTPLRGPIRKAISGYRYYSPELGRWVNRDPLEEAGGFNLYASCNNDHILLFDPRGTDIYYSDGVDGKHAYLIVDNPNNSNERIFYEFRPLTGGYGLTRITLNVIYGKSQTNISPWLAEVPSDFVRIPTTREQDALAIRMMYMLENAQLPYSFYANNCADMARMVIYSAGISIKLSRTIDTPRKLLKDIQYYLDQISSNSIMKCK